MRKILTSLIAVIVVAGLQAQQQNAPKLVVCITIDQLRGDYLTYFKGFLGENGFKRLMNDGIAYRHIQFEFANIDMSSAFATIHTGSNPCYHSITANKRYDFDKELEQSCVFDARFLGNYTTQNFSPNNLLSSTIGDELKHASKGASKVYSIAPEAESAILTAGHAADCAFWLDNYNGKWVTTTYYKNVPSFIDKFNSGAESLSARLSSFSWTPMLQDAQYSALPYIADKKIFKYTFNEKEVGCYPRFKTSPFVNSEITKLAIAFINNGELGTHPTPDLLSVSFYGGNFLDVQDKPYTQEVQDIYYQLDQNIGELLTAIDQKVGLNKTLIVVTGTGYYTDKEITPEGTNKIGGAFNSSLVKSLVNSALRKIYNTQKDWVKGFYNNQIYLNHQTIEDENLDLATVQNKAAEYVVIAAGVHQVVTDQTLRTGDWNEGSAALRYGTYHKGRGDLIIELMPGWGVDTDMTGQNINIKRNNAVVTPLFFYGNGIKPVQIDRSVYVTEIAPTITNILRIRAPSACSDIPLPEVK